jgi:hypothetical protein
MHISSMMIAGACSLLATSGEARTQPAQKETLLQTDHAWNGSPYPSYLPADRN